MEAAAPTLSPIRTWRNPQDLLAEFFDWLVQQPGYEAKAQSYTQIKRKLIEE
jgi:hypothetical protein